MAAQRQLVELHNQHQAALVKELQARICASGFDYVSILEALLPSAWILCRRKGKTYTQRRGPRWQLKGQPACTYTQGRFSRVLQQHMRAHGLDPEVQADRRYFLANFMERI